MDVSYHPSVADGRDPLAELPQTTNALYTLELQAHTGQDGPIDLSIPKVYVLRGRFLILI